MYFDLIIAQLISNYIKLNLLYVRTRSQVGPNIKQRPGEYKYFHSERSFLSGSCYDWTGVSAGVTTKPTSWKI